MTETPPGEPGVEAAILDAARSVLATAGYRGFSVEAVAARTGLDPVVIERRWPRKEELLVDIFTEAMTIGEIPDMGDSRQELSRAVRHMISLYTDWYRLEPALFEFAADRTADQAMIEQLRRCLLRRSREHVAAALRRAAARSDLPPDVDTDFVQDVWAGTIAYRRLVSGGTLTADIVNPLLDMVLSGMAPLRASDLPIGPRSQEPWPWWLQQSAGWLNEVAFGHVYPLTSGVPTRALAAVPTTAVIAGHPLTISAGAGRNFMPLSSSALSVGVTVAASGTGVLPPFLRADRVAVLNGDEVWVAPLVEENPQSRTSRKFHVGARQGPMWEPGASVDIVVQLKGESANVQLVRVPDQRIERAD